MKACKDNNQCHMKCNTDDALLYISMQECGYCIYYRGILAHVICVAIHNYIMIDRLGHLGSYLYSQYFHHVYRHV